MRALQSTRRDLHQQEEYISSCFSQGYPLVLALLRLHTYEFFPVISLCTRLKSSSWVTTRLYILYYNRWEAVCQEQARNTGLRKSRALMLHLGRYVS